MSQDKPEDQNRKPDPQWIQSMHAHYRQTGTYRTSDIHRVLGDPLRSVQVDAQTNVKIAAQIKR